MRTFLTAIVLINTCLFCRAYGTEDVFASKKISSKREAIVLSTLFPGLGQLSSGHKLRGTLMLVSEVSFLATALTSHENFKTRLGDFERLKIEYNEMAKGNSSLEVAQQKWSELSDTHNELDDLNLIRKISGAAAIGVYAYSLVDILLSHPSSPVVGWRLRVMPGTKGTQTNVVLSGSF